MLVQLTSPTFSVKATGSITMYGVFLLNILLVTCHTSIDLQQEKEIDTRCKLLSKKELIPGVNCRAKNALLPGVDCRVKKS